MADVCLCSYVVCAGHCGEAVHAPEENFLSPSLHFLLAVPLLFLMPPIQHIANVLLFDGIFIGMVVVFESGRTVTVDIVNAVFLG